MTQHVGALKDVSAIDLGAIASKAALERTGTRPEWVDHVVFGTNWPVDRMFSSYPDLIDAYAEIISGFSRDEQIRMFSGNAERIFRI